MVENLSRKICKLPEESIKIFKRYGFDIVDIKQLGIYSDFDKMCDDIEKEFRIVASQSIEQEEEGAVLYIVKRDSKESNYDEVLSLSKLKTLEYRIFRKMREKLRNYHSSKT